MVCVHDGWDPREHRPSNPVDTRLSVMGMDNVEVLFPKQPRYTSKRKVVRPSRWRVQQIHRYALMFHGDADVSYLIEAKDRWFELLPVNVVAERTDHTRNTTHAHTGRDV